MKILVKYILKITFLLVVIVFSISKQTIAQKKEVFEGRGENLKGNKGDLEYEYIFDKNTSKLFLDGKFKFESEEFDSLNKSKLLYLKTDGQYSNNIKSGEWRYESANLDLNFKGLRNYKPIFTANGDLEILKGNFKSGKADGRWQSRKQPLVESELKPGKSTARLDFNDGIATGNFYFTEQGDSTNIEIKGNFNENGFFDGDWEITYENQVVKGKEFRTYQNGFLLYLYKSENDSVLYDLKYNRVIDKLNLLEADSLDFNFKISNESFNMKFDDGFPENSDYYLAMKQGDDFLKIGLENFLDKENSPQFFFEGLQKMEGAFTARFEYEILDNEFEKISEISEIISRLKVETKILDENRLFSVNQQKTDSLAFAFQYFKYLRKHLLNATELIELLQSPYFENADRTKFFDQSPNYFEQIDTVAYSFNDKDTIAIIDYGTKVGSGESIVEEFYTHILFAKDYFNQIESYVEKELKTIEIARETQSLEYEMINLLDSIDYVYVEKTNENPRISQERKDWIDWAYEVISKQRRKQLQEYTNLDNNKKKQLLINDIIEEMTMALTIYDDLFYLSDLEEELSEAYYRYTYNPFMEGKDMRTRIKRRIYNKAVEDLIPVYFKELKQQNKVSEIKSSLIEIEEYKARMKEIAELPDNKTSKIERKLRWENNPEKIKEIIGL
ncbi:MAG: hypothetical protein LAT68_15400 [Cyclobacteriaceae bacterium]|nr:hypothetical protein [Cyclobacteriaceae bacterium]MCH8517707.1 hypothetical protein [Cyclobacteriaceae bacterium]